MEPADGWVALCSLLTPPYYIAVPVVKWVVIKRHGVEQVEALVSIPGSYTPRPLSESDPNGLFMQFVHVPTFTSQEFTTEDGRFSMWDHMKYLAAQQGQELAIQYLEQQQQAEPEPEDDDS